MKGHQDGFWWKKYKIKKGHQDSFWWKKYKIKKGHQDGFWWKKYKIKKSHYPKKEYASGNSHHHLSKQNYFQISVL